MGSIQPHFPTMMLVAIFSRHAEALQWARERIAQRWSAIALASEEFDFWETSFYTKEMGEGLRKQLLLLENWFDPGVLADCKLESNDWEDEYAKIGGHEEARPLNIDPGYLTLAKFVLATTKDREHRLYLRDGIYAEQTLFFAQKQWLPRPWTYPDYRRPDYHRFFHQARRHLKSCLPTDSSSPQASEDS